MYGTSGREPTKAAGGGEGRGGCHRGLTGYARWYFRVYVRTCSHFEAGILHERRRGSIRWVGGEGQPAWLPLPSGEMTVKRYSQVPCAGGGGGGV